MLKEPKDQQKPELSAEEMTKEEYATAYAGIYSDIPNWKKLVNKERLKCFVDGMRSQYQQTASLRKELEEKEKYPGKNWVHKEIYEDLQTINKMGTDMLKEKESEIENLKQQLSEKDREIEKKEQQLKEYSDLYDKERFEKRHYFEQLSDKNKEFDQIKRRIFTTFSIHHNIADIKESIKDIFLNPTTK